MAGAVGAGIGIGLAGMVQAAASGGASVATSTRERLLPPAVNPGDQVALVSPSSAHVDRLDLQLAQEVLQALGLKVHTGAYVSSRHGHLAGTDTERAADINAAFADEGIRAVIALRGGSGAARLLPLLDYAAIRANPKPLLGYSDITALHCALQAQTGLVSFHGPNGSGSWNGFNADQFRRMFFQREQMHYRNEPDPGDELVPRRDRTLTITPGRAQGELLGGNLAVLTALSGTPYLPDFSGRILFLEEVAEAPYRIDRMLTTLKLSGALSRIAGLIFGHCTDCSPGETHGSLSLDQILDEHIKPLGVPAYRGAMIGHIPRQFIVPVGGRVEMDADTGTFRLLESVFAGV